MTERVDVPQTELSQVLEGERRWCVVHGEASDVLWVVPDCSFDAMVTDPPGGIGFMGRDWDKDGGSRDIWVERLEAVMREAYRVLKPGAHGLVWALPRTSHWTAWALEEAGFEIRDRLIHLFGTGFPKSHDVSKAIDARLGTTGQRNVVHEYTAGGNAGTSTADKGGTYVVGAPNSEAIKLTVTTGGSPEARQWDGWGTNLKPAAEDWWLVRKPLDGTVADNVLAHGCGALNVDACRIATDWSEPDRPQSWKRSGHSAKPGAEKIAAPPGAGIQCHPGGRWPAHVVFSHDEECGKRCTSECAVRRLDGQSGMLTSGVMPAGTPIAGMGYSGSKSYQAKRDTFADTGTASRFFYCAKPGRVERELGLDGFRQIISTALVKYPEVQWVSEVLNQVLQEDTVRSAKKATVGSTTRTNDGSVWSMCWCGSPATDPCHQVFRSIIETVRSSTIDSKTWKSSQRRHTNGCIAAACGVVAVGGSPANCAEFRSPSQQSTGTSRKKGGHSMAGVDDATLIESWLTEEPVKGGGHRVANSHPT